jgi:hypothetical protein
MSVGSALMLDKANALNTINPFASYGPGTSNKPYGFAPGAPDKDQVKCDSYGCSMPGPKPSWEPYQASPLCDWGIHAHTNGSLNAPSCLPKKNPVSCPMGRPLEPTRELIPDLYTLIPYKDPIPKELQSGSSINPVFYVAAAVLVVLFLVKR